MKCIHKHLYVFFFYKRTPLHIFFIDLFWEKKIQFVCYFFCFVLFLRRIYLRLFSNKNAILYFECDAIVEAKKKVKSNYKREWGKVCLFIYFLQKTVYNELKLKLKNLKFARFVYYLFDNMGIFIRLI